MTLRLRLALLFTLSAVFIVALAGTLMFFQLRATLEASLDSSLTSRATALQARLTTTPASLGLAQQKGTTPDVGQILSAEGQVLDSTPDAGPDPLVTPAEVQHALQAPLQLTRSVRDERTRLLAIPSRQGGDTLIIVGQRTDVTDAAQDRVRAELVAGSVPATLLAGIGAWLLAGAALQPVSRLRRQTAAMSEHDSAARLAVPRTRDEISDLAATFNGLLERLQQAREHERGFVADASHELRTPLAILRMELELAARPGRSLEELTAALSAAGSETERLIRLAEDLLLMARADQGDSFLRRKDFDSADVLEPAVHGATVVGADRNVTVRLDNPVDLRLVADPDRLRQALDNLLSNALRHAPDGTAVCCVARRAGGHLVIQVRDQGPGFPPEFLPYAFERFRRADDARSRTAGGSGLGLAIVQSIVRAHHGTVEASNAPNGGAVVTLTLPQPEG